MANFSLLEITTIIVLLNNIKITFDAETLIYIITIFYKTSIYIYRPICLFIYI